MNAKQYLNAYIAAINLTRTNDGGLTGIVKLFREVIRGHHLKS